MRRNGRSSALVEPLLAPGAQPLSGEEALALELAEQRRLRTYAGLVAMLGVLEVGVTLWGAAGPEHGPFDAQGFDLTTDLADVSWMVVVKLVLLVALAARAVVEEKSGALGLSVYWSVFAVLTYAVGKLIAFDWDAGLSARGYVALFAWIAFGTAQLVTLGTLDRWVHERTLWTERETGGEGDAEEQETATGARVKQVDAEKEKKKGSVATKSLLQVMRPYFWPHGLLNKLRCLMTWVFLGISKASNLMSPIYIGKAVQELSDKGVSESRVFEYVALYGGLVLASKVFKELQNVVYLRVKQTAYVEIAEQTFRHLHTLSLEWHLMKKMGNVLRSMDRGVAAANTLVTYLFLYLLPSVAECVVVFVIFYTHFKIPTVSATAFVSFVAYAVITVQITLWRKKFREKTNKHDNDYHDKATDSLINYETVKYFTAEDYEIARYTDSIFKFQTHSVNTAYSLSLLNSMQSLIVQGCTVLSLCLAAHQVREGKLEVGQFVSISAYISSLFAPLSFLGSIYNAIIQALVDMTNLSDLLAEEPDLVDAPNAPALIPVPGGAEGATVEFKNVHFQYPTQSSGGLEGVSFTVEPGTTTAIVGHTGAGKSTIGRLLFRFYDPAAGKVLVSNQDIKLVTQQSLRGAIGVVPQDTVLFNDTLRHNIAYGKPDATEAEIERACQSAQILDFIRNQPEGFNTMVGERGLRLSGGEKQRVAIARCLLKNPPVVLLDEATSALDTLTERSVQAALNTLTVKRTTIVIAHRLSTIRDANQIIVLDKGRILEKGTHQELLAQRGTYSELWHSRVEQEQDQLAAEAAPGSS